MDNKIEGLKKQFSNLMERRKESAGSLIPVTSEKEYIVSFSCKFKNKDNVIGKYKDTIVIVIDQKVVKSKKDLLLEIKRGIVKNYFKSNLINNLLDFNLIYLG